MHKGKPDDRMFKAVQKAWEVLSDERRRRIYDSSEDFDDRAPSISAIESGNFYEIFGNVFERWAK